MITAKDIKIQIRPENDFVELHTATLILTATLPIDKDYKRDFCIDFENQAKKFLYGKIERMLYGEIQDAARRAFFTLKEQLYGWNTLNYDNWQKIEDAFRPLLNIKIQEEKVDVLEKK